MIKKVILILLVSSTLNFSVPEWEKGDSWTYDIELVINLDGDTSFNCSFKDLEFRVAGGKRFYKVEYEGEIIGDFSQLIPLPIEKAKIEGNIKIGKSHLEIKEIFAYIDATAQLLPVKAYITMISKPPISALRFPLFVGKNWTIPSYNISLFYHLFTVLEAESGKEGVVTEEMTLFCTSKDTITVKAGTFDALRICDDSGKVEIFYSPVVGNIVKAEGKGEFGYVFLELKSTTYESGGPYKPNLWGPGEGEEDWILTYCANTSDPQNDQVYFWFDWGDGTNSGWVGPYKSSQVACINHSWKEDGKYWVRVKAKDENDLESQWSDPLIVIIGKEDKENPSVEIIKPKRGIYFNNRKVAFFPLGSIVIGNLTIEVRASDEISGIERVEFYANKRLIDIDAFAPYTCDFTQPPNIYKIEVVAYDNAGNSDNDFSMIIKLL
jgi:hypothetical protein